MVTLRLMLETDDHNIVTKEYVRAHAGFTCCSAMCGTSALNLARGLCAFREYNVIFV
jgi:hypothetical protein